MTPEVLTAQHDRTVREPALFFDEHQISGASVVDDEGKLVGVVSLTDMVRTAAEIGAEIVGYFEVRLDSIGGRKTMPGGLDCGKRMYTCNRRRAIKLIPGQGRVD